MMRSELLRTLLLANEPEKLQPEKELLLDDDKPESSDCRQLMETF